MNINAGQTSYVSYFNQTATTRPVNADPRQASPSPENSSESQPSDAASGATKEARNTSKGPLDELSTDEQRIVDELKKRDAEVKAHESAHIAAGGPYVRGGASYEYEKGPDNQNYAVGGEVSIDVSAENTPEATIRKMQVVKRAALAPRDPSGQDRSVAAQATQTEARARIELQKERSEEAAEKDEKVSGREAENDTGNSDSATDNLLSQQALTAYRQTEITTNPLNISLNSSSFNASA